MREDEMRRLRLIETDSFFGFAHFLAWEDDDGPLGVGFAQIHEGCADENREIGERIVTLWNAACAQAAS
jgi:hypothetical protein